MNNKLYVIDGNSLLFRAYYATAYAGTENIMRTKSGIPTNAIFAFANMINKIISGFKGNESIIVGFDAGKKTFRHEEDEDYKANRKPCPEELLAQMGPVRELLHSLGIYTYEQIGVEGDDVCGTIAKIASKNGYKVDIFTSDRDFLQLIDENITIDIIVKGMKDIKEMTPISMKEEYGFDPLQIIDYKGLRGDSSDNLPGIPGIGEKTATNLIKQYGSFENILANAEKIGGKVGSNLIEFQEQGKKCKHLATILTDVELPFGLEDLIYQGYDFDKINNFCQKYELKQFLNRLPVKLKNASLVNESINPIEITTLKDIDIPNEINIALDIDNGNYHNAQVFGLAINFDKNHYYIKETDFNDKYLKDILENININKNCYDFKAIKVALNKYDINIKGLSFDILLAAYNLDSSLQNDIDSVMHYFSVDLPKKEKESVGLFDIEEGNKERTNMLAYQIGKIKKSALNSLSTDNTLKLFSEIEIPLCDVLADMEIEGFPLNINKLNEIGASFKEKLNILSEEIYKIAGRKFNISSPKQVGEVLFNELNLPESRNQSTSVEVLNSLKDKHPIVPLILEHRKYAKLISTYIDGLAVHIKDDNKIHAMFNQALTQTGRLSSSEPNLQNISVRDEEGKLIRKAFYYQEEGYSILSLDYSQIELRILASLSHCQSLIDIFNSDEDIHSATARKVFHVEGEVSSLQRRKAKAVNFGIVYGISDWGLSEQLGISVYESKEIINSFYEAYPEIGQFLSNLVIEVTNKGYVTTINGRRRYLREIYDTNYQVREFAKRAAMNAPIQGTAADLIKIAMIKVKDMLVKKGYKTKLVLQIHDELLFKVPDDEKDIILDEIKNIMEHAIDIDVRLSVDGGFGRTWYDAK